MQNSKTIINIIILFIWILFNSHLAYANSWQNSWPETDFTKTNIDLSEVRSGGPPRDGIPPIDKPEFFSLSEAEQVFSLNEPVISVSVKVTENGVIKEQSRAYPLQILIWHEIVNDEILDQALTITFCPLCNAAIVFDRVISDGRTLDFGTTGNLRKSDLIMWDRQTESWWQQFLGEAIAGEMTGEVLKPYPSRLESFGDFAKRNAANDAYVLSFPKNVSRPYGRNPYVGYDSGRPFLYNGETPSGMLPLERVFSLEDRKTAWSLSYLKNNTPLKHGQITIKWSLGQSSALDTAEITKGKDVGTVTATDSEGNLVIGFVDFAFAFHAFYPNAPIHHK